MRKQGGGIIVVNITSLGGRISFPLNSAYHVTKFALEGLSIQYELEPFGIKIIFIEPGGVGSNFLTYPSEVAKAILQAVTLDNTDFRYVVGKDTLLR